MNHRELMKLHPNTPRIDGPNHNELERMTEITAKVRRAIEFSRTLKFNEARLDFATAEELLQMLSDGLRTARQIELQQRQRAREWQAD